jgi:hypothetical protein
MRYCIPDELFNRIPYPELPSETAEVPMDGIFREVFYKLPSADPVMVKRETWHAFCDFCSRLGALLMRQTGGGRQVAVETGEHKFLRIVGAKADGVPVVPDSIEVVANTGGDTKIYAMFPEGTSSCEVVYSVRPAFDYEPAASQSADREWAPTTPQYMIDRYGECIAHGALARIYAVRGDGALARMHATAYNNDLNRLAFGLITAGMRKHLLIDIEDWLVNTNGNG